VQQVRHGQNGMPAFRPTEITRSELDALAKWISASKADPAEKGQ
jgi:mono/diheme cytochrome c family protein